MPNAYRVLTLVLIASHSFVAPAGAQTLPQGSVTVARARGDAIAIWDATPTLTALIAKKTSRKDVLSQLESDATLVFADKANVLKKSAKTLSIIVLYAKIGAISPTYHVATFEGVERLFMLKAPTRAAAEGRKWAAEILRGAVPHGLLVTITGKLPPEIH